MVTNKVLVDFWRFSAVGCTCLGGHDVHDAFFINMKLPETFLEMGDAVFGFPLSEGGASTGASDGQQVKRRVV
jgi:hypothetical protein